MRRGRSRGTSVRLLVLGAARFLGGARSKGRRRHVLPRAGRSSAPGRVGVKMIARFSERSFKTLGTDASNRPEVKSGSRRVGPWQSRPRRACPPRRLSAQSHSCWAHAVPRRRPARPARPRSLESSGPAGGRCRCRPRRPGSSTPAPAGSRRAAYRRAAGAVARGDQKKVRRGTHFPMIETNCDRASLRNPRSTAAREKKACLAISAWLRAGMTQTVATETLQGLSARFGLDSSQSLAGSE
jgi:hypothetical protein